MKHILVGAAVCILAFVSAAHANSIEITPADSFENVANGLAPGDELILRGGTYTFNGSVRIVAQGTASDPIVIRSATGETAVLDQASSNHNVLEISDSAHLVLRGLEVTRGSHGIRLMNSDYITIEECDVHDTGDVAISANSGGTYDGLKILRNHIHHTNDTGEGMYLGCNNDSCRVANSLIEGNHVHHTNGPTITQGDGIEIKEGSYGNVVRDNVIHDTNYPGILTYSAVGNGPPNVIERNVIWNTNDSAIQSAADATIRNNIILGSVAFQSHQNGSPSNIEFVHNTVISSSNGVNVRNVTGPVLIANNAIYAQGTAISLISGSTGLVSLSANIGAGSLSGGSGGYSDGQGIGVDLAGAHYGGAPPINVFPAPGSAVIGAANSSYSVPVDFNATSRGGSNDVGAYRFDPSGNPGWTVSASFKQLGSGASGVPKAPTNVTVQ